MKHFGQLFIGALALAVVPALHAGDAGKKFAKLDADNDGQITRAEHAAGAERMFAEMDADRDGIVTVTEMDANKPGKKPEHARHEMSASDKLKLVDQNGDGRLTSAEHTAHAAAKFTEMDTNNDGSLSRDELQAGHKQLKQKVKAQR